MRATTTSYDNSTIGQGSIVNEVRFEYDEFAQLVTNYQSHSGAVNTMSTPKVQYGYAVGSDNTIRPTSLTYPNGRVITFGYGTSGGIDDAASRIASLIDSNVGSTHLADYSYLGRSEIVEVDDTQPEVKFTLVDLSSNNDPDTGDIYTGLDRFGRIKDNRWYDYGASDDAARLSYGYSRASIRLWREDVVAVNQNKDFDELYAYDGLYRLIDMQRGRLNAQKDGLANKTFAQDWSLDATGNWPNFRQDDDGNGTWDLDQQRTADEVNEITGISETAGPSWVTPAYSLTGNMTRVPQPADSTKSFTATYDAWNRLVKLVDDDTSNTVQENEYDGRRFCVVRKGYVSGSLDATRHFYYTHGWQCLEERVDSSSDAERQFVWGRRYIDDLVVRDRDTTGNGTLDERLYALQDANWNVVALANASGTVQQRFAYDSYGKSIVLAANFTPTTDSYDWEYRFTGRELDLNSGLDYFRNRYYHNRMGGFISRDPVTYIDGMSLYAYVSGNPLSFVDPMGLDKCQDEYDACWTAASTSYLVCAFLIPPEPIHFTACTAAYLTWVRSCKVTFKNCRDANPLPPCPPPPRPPRPGHWTRGCCFVEGTQILLADGSTKAIEGIQFGDEITSYDFDLGITVSRRICMKDNPVRDNVIDLSLSNGNTVSSTKDHPYWVAGKGWCSADPEATLAHYTIFSSNHINVQRLQEGDRLLVASQSQVLESGEDTISVTEVTLELMMEREAMPYSLWILRVGDYGVDWRIAKELFDAAQETGDFARYYEEMEQMKSLERNPHNHNFFANGVLVHNK